MTATEVSQVTGVTLSEAPGGGTELTGDAAEAAAGAGFALTAYRVCRFVGDGNQLTLFIFQMAGEADAAQFYSQMGGGQVGQPYPGVGDEATSLTTGLLVRSGSDVLSVLATIQADPVGDHSALLAEIARLVLGRL